MRRHRFEVISRCTSNFGWSLEYLEKKLFDILSRTHLRLEIPLNSQEILEQIEEEISRLQQVKALLQGSNGHRHTTAPRVSESASAAPKVKGKRVLSDEARKKIAAAQRRRWANARKAQAK